MPCSVCLILVILDQGQVTKYLCGIPSVMYLLFFNYSSAGPECQSRHGCGGAFLIYTAVHVLLSKVHRPISSVGRA